MVRAEQQLVLPVVTLIHLLEEGIGFQFERLVGHELGEVLPHGDAVAFAPNDLIKFQPIDRRRRAVGSFGIVAAQVAGFVFQRVEEACDERLIVRSGNLMTQFRAQKPPGKSAEAALRADARRRSLLASGQSDQLDALRRRQVGFLLVAEGWPQLVFLIHEEGLQLRLSQVVIAPKCRLMPEEIQGGSNQLRAVGQRQRGDFRHLFPCGFIGGDFVQLHVGDVQQRALFQVWQDDAPAAPQVMDRPQREIVLEHGEILALPKGRQFLFQIGEVEEAQTELFANSAANVLCAQAVLRTGRDRPPDGGPHAHHVHEIIEVTGLQRGVLPVVGEAEKFLVAHGELVCRHLCQDGVAANAGGGAAAFRAELAELGHVARVAVRDDARSWIKEQWRTHEPAFSPSIPPGLGIVARHSEPNATRHSGAVMFHDAEFAAGSRLHPCGRQEFEIGVRIPDADLWNEVAVLQVAVTAVFTGEELAEDEPLRFRMETDTMEFAAAVTAECSGEQWTLRLPRAHDSRLRG